MVTWYVVEMVSLLVKLTKTSICHDCNLSVSQIKHLTIIAALPSLTCDLCYRGTVSI